MTTNTLGSTNSTADNVKDTLHTIGDAATRATTTVSNKAAAMGQSAVGAIDAQRAPLANGIDGAASTLHSGAASLTDTASYLRNNKVSDMLGDVQNAIKAYPTVALIGAAVIGFAAARMMRRD